MTLKSWLAGLAGAVTLGIVTLPAEAAPAAAPNMWQDTPQKANVQQAHWDGRRYYRPHRYYYGPRYRYRHYYRPGIRFYYGPRYHRRHWHYRHW